MLYVSPETLNYLRAQQRRVEAIERQKAAVAVRKKRRQLNEHSHEIFVGRAVRLLKSGRSTFFEHESACRSGFRKALILRGGWSWDDADATAASIVEAAFRKMGVVRPTYLEGQPEYAENARYDRYYCARCQGLIPTERRLAGAGRTRFCSSLCRTAEINRIAYATGSRRTFTEYLAAKAAASEKTRAERSGKCKQCGTEYTTEKQNEGYCSRKCWGASRRLADVKCLHCSTVFHPKNGGKSNGGLQRYCSVQCVRDAYKQSIADSKPEIVCRTCRAVFRSTCSPSRTPVYCSPSCNPRSPTFVGRSAFACEETR